MNIVKGTIVTNVKTGKQYVAGGAPYEGNGGRVVVYVRAVNGRGGGHYMQVANLTVDTEYYEGK